MRTGNIVGEQFDGFVSSQIDVRQQLQNEGYQPSSTRSQTYQQLLNNQNAWLKLSSSVRVKNTAAGQQRLKDIGISNASDFTGDNLARKTVLFNTLSTITPATYKDGKSVSAGSNQTGARAGVTTSPGLWNNNAYGLGGPKFGLVPPPGLISAKIDCKNRGSIREATVQIKCYNQFQFELLETVYLRLGYSMLLEWGWDKYLSNKGNLVQTGTTICENEWFNESKSSNFQYVLDLIQRYRSRYNANYDGFMGKVVNFDWKFGADGTYDITLKLITSGDVIESLKVNLSSAGIAASSIASLQTEISGSDTLKNISDSTVVATAGASTLSYDLYTDITSDVEKWDLSANQPYNKNYMAWYSVLASDLTGVNEDSYTNIEEEDVQSNGAIANLDNYNYFMTFSQLLEKIRVLVLPNISGRSILDINNSDDNICSIFPYLISFDPKVCLIKPFILDDRTAGKATADKDTTINVDWTWMNNMKEFGVIENSGATIYGKIMNIYLNYDFISKTLNDVNENGEILLFKFLSKICDGVNEALGGCTKLEPILTDDRVITIIDQNPINGIEKSEKYKSQFAPPESVKFEIYGYNTTNNTSNFVRDFGFNTKITPELAAMISIGAAADNVSTKNYDGTAWSKWNQGLYDAYQMDYVDPPQSTNKSESYPLPQSKIDEYFKIFEAAEIDTADGADWYNDSWVEKAASYVFGDTKNKVRPENNQVFTNFGKSAKGLRDVGGRQNISWTDWSNLKAEEWQNEIAKTAQENKSDDGKGTYFEYLAACFGGTKRGEVINKALDSVKYQQLNPDWIEQGKSGFKGFQNLINTAIYNATETPSNVAGFIPIDCNLSCDGISGIKIYQQLEIRQDFLPKQYPKAVKFLITKVNHDISDNDWKTSLDTVSTPLTKGLESADFSVSITEVIQQAEDSFQFDPVQGDQSNVRCAAGTDLGVQDGYNRGKRIKIRVCKVQGVQVNAIQSYKWDQFFKDINNDPVIKKLGKVSAYGWRSMATQISVGKTNGCPANWTSSSQCRVPTARPGYSNHQMGQALDITLNGSTIKSRTSPVFQWLAKNGASYGLVNFPKEAWHWSVDGR